jgi:hypothetical protein
VEGMARAKAYSYGMTSQYLKFPITRFSGIEASTFGSYTGQRMKKALSKTLLLAAAVFLCESAHSQTVTLKAVNGKNGKPLANQRLLVFAGSNADEVRFQQHSYDLKTDVNGLATLTVDDASIRRIQVWADYQHLCQSTPNFRSFDLGEITSTGLSTPNDCGTIVARTVPGLLTIFVRPRTRREIRDE